MARTLLSKSCAKLCKFIEKILQQPDFIARHRLAKNAFVRNRLLPFQTIILFLLNFLRGSYQDELDAFFKNIRAYKVPRRIVTKSAFSKARKKISHRAFIELNQHQIAFFHQEFRPRTWHGFRLAVFDGSTVRLPRAQEIAEHFGVWDVRKGKPCPAARVSQLFDPLNRLSLDALIAPIAIGERELAARHCEHLSENTLVLLDQGYPCFWLFKLILTKGAQFCSRISTDKWKIVRKFYRSSKPEQIVTIPPPVSSMKRCRQHGLDTTPLRCRLIRIELDSGQTEILITSLLDTHRYPWELFQELYHYRWPVEEDFKVIKVWLAMENFSGKSVLSVYQDFHAKIFSKNLTSILAFPVADAVEQQRPERRYRYKINFAQALSKTKHTLVLLFQRSYRQTIRLIERLQQIFVATTEPVRPGRTVPRPSKASPRKYFLNYKPIC